jgi:hypothetical protein
MTNHPRKRHDITSETERDQSAAEALAGDLLPAEPGDIPPQGSAEVPAHTGNGVPPGLRANAAKVLGQAIASTLAETLPQMLFQALATALSQVQVQTVTQQHFCATCIIGRVMWENSHRADMEKAMTAAAQAAGAGERNGIPNVAQAVTTHQGADLCAMHLAQAAGIQPGRSQLLVATATMNPAMLGQLAGPG